MTNKRKRKEPTQDRTASLLERVVQDAKGDAKGALAPEVVAEILAHDRFKRKVDSFFESARGRRHAALEAKAYARMLERPVIETAPTVPASTEAPGASTPQVLATKRRAFVGRILAEKGWSDWDWMIHAKLDWKTVKRYLDGGKNYRDTRKKLAKPLGIDPIDLP